MEKEKMDVREKIAVRLTILADRVSRQGAIAYAIETGEANEVDKATDDLIAIIREALLSEQAVEASTEAGYAASSNGVWGDNAEELTGKQIVHRAHLAGLQAALAAAGLGGQGDSE